MGQDNRVEKLEAQIEILKAKLQDAQITYLCTR